MTSAQERALAGLDAAIEEVRAAVAGREAAETQLHNAVDQLTVAMNRCRQANVVERVQ
jgi:flagellar biosynthesis/type III secretory pathway chaperone